MNDLPDRQLLDHADFLRGLARGLVARDDEVEDLVQDTLTSALQSPRRPRNVRAWLARIARNRAISRWRREHERRDRERAAAAGPRATPGPSESAAQLELQRKVVEAVQALDEPYRDVIVQRFYYGIGPAEIARRLGVPRETVKTRLVRALEQLRARLDARHGGQRARWLGGLVAFAFGDAAAKSALPAAAIAAATLVLGLGSVAYLAHAATSDDDEPKVRAADAGDGDGSETSEMSVSSAPDVPEEGLRGRVRAEGGGPVAGAHVVLKALGRKGMEGRLWFEVPGETVATAVTGAEGAFHFTPAGDGPWFLTVEAEGFLRHGEGIRNPNRGVPVNLVSGEERALRVLDPDGRPVAGAEVLALPWFARGLPSARGVTDARGFVRMRAPIGLNLVVRAEGFAWTMLDHRKNIEEVRLEPGYVLAGRTVDDRKAPVASARLEVPRFFHGREEIAVGADGRFRIEGLPKEQLMLRSFAPGHAAAHLTVWPGDEACTIVLQRTGSVRGRVVRPDGAPAAGVQVTASGSSGRVITDAEGRFFSPEVMPGEHEIWAHHEKDKLAARVMVEVAPRAETSGVVLRLESFAAGLVEGFIRLRVVDPDGRPVAGLRAFPNADEEARSDVDGVLVARVLQRERQRLRFRVNDPKAQELAKALKRRKSETGAWRGWAEADPRDNASGPVVVVVARRPVAVDFIVRDPGGGALAPGVWASVQIRLGTGSWKLRKPDGVHARWLVYEEPGPYVFGKYRVTVAAAGYRTREIRDWRPPAGGGVVELRVERGHTVRGHLVDAAGRPLGGATVVIQRRGPWREWADTATADGTFAVRGLPAGRLAWAVARSEQDVPGFVGSLEIPGADVDLGRVVVPAPRALEGKVVGPEGRPLGGVHVRLPENLPAYDVGRHSALTHADGKFAIRVPAGVVGVLRLAKAGWGSVPRPLADLEPGVAITFVMRPGVELRFRVADQNWPHDVTLRDPETGVRWEPDSRGEFDTTVIEDLPPARLVLELVGEPDDRRIEREIDLRTTRAVDLGELR